MMLVASPIAVTGMASVTSLSIRSERGTMVTIISNVIYIFFLLILFLILNESRLSGRSNVFYGIAVFMFCAATYSLAVVCNLPNMPSALLFLTIPSFLLFFWSSKYRDFRFVFTFCAVDVLGAILLGVCNFILISADLAEIALLPLYVVGFVGLLICALYVRKSYRQVQASLKKGWGGLAALSGLFYIAIYFVTGYPKPLLERPEYIPVLCMVFLMIIATYLFMFQMIGNLKKNYEFEQNEQLLKVQLELKNSQLKEQELYQRLAYIDSMTGLNNRTAFNQDKVDIQTQWKSLLPISCISIDLNNLKVTNDTYGHLRGDALICGLADILKESTRENGKVYRMGGDEFLIFLFHTEKDGCEALKQSLNTSIDYYNKAHKIPLSPAIGTATLDQNSFSDINMLIHMADREMYAEKQRCKSGAGWDTSTPGD